MAFLEVVAVVHVAWALVWALGVAELDGGVLAGAVVWTAVWGLHARLLRDPAVRPAHELAGVVARAGSAVGLIALVTGVGGMLLVALRAAYEAATGAAIVERPATEALRQSLAVVLVGAPVVVALAPGRSRAPSAARSCTSCARRSRSC